MFEKKMLRSSQASYLNTDSDIPREKKVPESSHLFSD